MVASWLLDLTAPRLRSRRGLEEFSGRVSDSGEGRWTVHAAVDEGVPANVLTTALFERFSSRGEADFADQLLSAMRSEFGGHVEQPPAADDGDRGDAAPAAVATRGPHVPDDHVIVLFGATGDLAQRKLLPGPVPPASRPA